MNPRFKPLADLTTDELREYHRTAVVPELADDDTATALIEAGYVPNASDEQRGDLLDETIQARDLERKREVELDELAAMTPDDHARRQGRGPQDDED